MAKWFLKTHDFIHVNSSVAGKYNKHKQDGSHLRFPIRMILATADLQVTSILPMNIEQQFELFFFYLQVSPMLPTKFPVNWPFSSEEEGKNRFSRWLPSWMAFQLEQF